MKKLLRRWGWSAALLLAAPAFAHHSFAMFDREHKIWLEGTVREFRYTSPHPFIVLEVAQKKRPPVAWNLEGSYSPSVLVRHGWARDSVKAGDRLRIHVSPLRSGAPGGAWTPEDVYTADGGHIGRAKGT